MIIGACGYGGTGSSAVKDYLKEFEGIQTLDRAECQYAFKVDGLQDLEFHLVKQYSRQMSGDLAIKRFRYAAKYARTPFVKKLYIDRNKYLKDTDDFLESIVQAEYLGFDNADYETGNLLKSIVILGFKKFVIPIYEKKSGRLYDKWPVRKMHVAICPENFYEEARSYVNKILKNGGADFSKKIVLDQPFEGNNPTQSFSFFEDAYAIVVDRDPRDLYMAASYQWPDGMFMPRRNPKAFVEYFRQQRDNIRHEEDKDRVLRVRLENMIFNYDITSELIMKFLGLEEKNHVCPKKYFNPEYSIKGTQLYKKIPGHEKELRYIEEELAEYLFPFEEYEEAKKNNSLVWIP